MFDTHAYEVLPGEVLFRRSGNNSRTFIMCKIVRTRARAYPQHNGMTRVDVMLLATGSETLEFEAWFPDWDVDRDNPRDDMQGGRPIDVAIEASMLDRIIQTGSHIQQHVMPLEQQRFRPFGVPLVAVRIGDRWVDPELPTPGGLAPAAPIRFGDNTGAE